MILANVSSILITFSKNQFFILLIFSIVFSLISFIYAQFADNIILYLENPEDATKKTNWSSWMSSLKF